MTLFCTTLQYIKIECFLIQCTIRTMVNLCFWTKIEKKNWRFYNNPNNRAPWGFSKNGKIFLINGLFLLLVLPGFSVLKNIGSLNRYGQLYLISAILNGTYKRKTLTKMEHVWHKQNQNRNDKQIIGFFQRQVITVILVNTFEYRVLDRKIIKYKISTKLY